MIAGSVLLAAAGVFAVPATVLNVECLASLIPERARERERRRPRIAVLIPAHDEEAGIGRTLASICSVIRPGDRVLVVADNCSDRTAQASREAGAEVVERSSATERGKGYALSFGLEQLAGDPPEVVIIVDADCEVAPDTLDLLADAAASLGRPAQAEYLLGAAGSTDVRSAISAFALLVRNRVRPRGLARLGLPCQLTGSGMAFPWRVVREARPTGANVVEDLVLGLDLSARGYAPVFVESAHVRSRLPDSASAQSVQRRRWETGQLATMLEFAPGMLASALRRADVAALSTALDLCVPPLSLYVSLLAGGLLLSALIPGAGAAATLFGAELGSAVLVLGAVWWRDGRDVLPLRRVWALPAYVVWKLPLYISFVLRGRERSWVRTQR